MPGNSALPASIAFCGCLQDGSALRCWKACKAFTFCASGSKCPFCCGPAFCPDCAPSTCAHDSMLLARRSWCGGHRRRSFGQPAKRKRGRGLRSGRCSSFPCTMTTWRGEPLFASLRWRRCTQLIFLRNMTRRRWRNPLNITLPHDLPALRVCEKAEEVGLQYRGAVGFARKAFRQSLLASYKASTTSGRAKSFAKMPCRR